MHDYRLDVVDTSERHPNATARRTGRRRSRVDHTGGELPGRKVDGRR
jgi:hypothetical protein